MGNKFIRLCVICGEYPTSQPRAAACKSPKCKRMLEDERRRMDIEKQAFGTESLRRFQKSRYAKENPLHNQTIARNRANELMEIGFSESEAIGKVARQFRMKPAEVLYACRSTKT
jgi:hypothetical protein